TPALSVDNSGTLKLPNAALTVAGVQIGKSGGSSAALILEEGSSLASAGEIAVAIDDGSNGSLGISSSAVPSALSAGSITVGNEGDGDFFALGLSTVDITGSLFFGVLPGSKGVGIWTGLDGSEVPTEINVGDTLFVG